MTRSTDECEMSRSCHSATSSNAACRLPRSTRASPRQLLRLHRVPLVRHRARALLLALRGTAPRPRAPRCAAGGGSRARTTRSSRRATRTRTSPRRGGRGRAPGSPAPAAARAARTRTARRTGRRWSTCRPRPTACRPRSTSRARAQALAVAAHLHRPQRELHAERRRLGVDAVRAADHRRVAELARARARSRLRAWPPPRGSRSSARVICSASAVSTTSLDVRP